MVEPATIIAGVKQFGLAPDGSDLRDLEAVFAAYERQIAELRAKEETWHKLYQQALVRENAVTAERDSFEAENARLRALPLKDEVERVLEEAKERLQFGFASDRDVNAAVRIKIDALLSRLRAGEQKQDGLSEWAGWDRDREPWGEAKHKDAVLEALFRGPWSVEDAATLIGFIDRTWTRRPAAPKQGEAK